jgi:hypothetical protein
MDRAEQMIPKILTQKHLDGTLLADLHFTHGFYPEIVEFFTHENIDKYIMDEYEVKKLLHSQNSKTTFKLT